MENKVITARMMFEMLGRPPEHLIETMTGLIEAIGAEKGIKVKDKKIHDARKIDNKDKEGNIITDGELYSTFSEIEVEAESVSSLLSLQFKYLPAHMELISPEEFKWTNGDFNMMANEILAKLHQYDAVAKSALMNNQILAKKISELMRLGIEQNKLVPVQAQKQEDKPVKKTKKNKK